jgi:hypothetical protein
MFLCKMSKSLTILMSLLLLLPSISLAEPHNEGPKVCMECHEAEYDVWKETKHFAAYKDVHKKPKAKEILAAIGGAKSMKKSPVCSTCHYTLVKKKADKPAKAKAGPSCESCHGPSSDWKAVHNEYGSGAKADTETAEHKQQRYSDAKDAGMIWSFMHYELAENCTSCHGLSRDDVEPEILAKLVANGHPANENFEYIAYSQGSVRHRFYPPDVTVNAEMDTIQLSRTYVIGQAAILVSASNGLARATDDKYKLFQQNRFDAAKLALSAITDIPEIKKLLDEPTSENGKKLAEAIKDVDLSKSVAKMLPEKSKYK